MIKVIKIVHLISGLEIGGAETMLAKLVTRMDRVRFHNIVVCMLPEGPLSEPILAAGISVYSLGMRRGIPSPLALIRLYRLLQRERPDVLQTWLYHADLLGFVAGKLAGVPKLIWNLRCSNMEIYHYSHLSAWTIKICAYLSIYPYTVIVNSHSGKEIHECMGYQPKRWDIIPNGFDLEYFRPDPQAIIKVRQDLGVSENTFFIGLAARFDPMKDHATFLHAAGLLAQNYPDVHFLLCGDQVTWENREITALVEEYHLTASVHLLGQRHDVPHLMAALDIVSSSSCGEGFPNVVGEAMACGVPCAVTDVGDSAIIVGNTGKVVPPKNPGALALAWKELIEIGKDKRQKLGYDARLRINKKFSLPAIVKQYEELYKCVA